MIDKASAAVCAVLTALAFASGLAAAVHLPPGAQIPVHFGIDGQPNGWAGRWFGTLAIPAVSAGVWVLLAVVVPIIEPRKANLAKSRRAYGTGWVAITAMLTFLQGVILALAFGSTLNPTRLTLGAIGGLFVVVGNVLGKTSATHTFGIRTRWTLADEDIWDKTHRFAGWVFVLGGALVLTTAFFLPAGAGSAAVTAAVIAAVALLPPIKSYLLWREKQTGGPPNL